jgi:pimeloyl-ACP methyl ester carboxylesterase
VTSFRILTWGNEDALPVVCVHGIGGHARRFERLARMLEDRRFVIAYDLRGHGRSPWAGEQSLEGHCGDLEEVLDACGIDQSMLVGAALGGRIALEFAATRGDRVTGLCLLDPPLFATRPRPTAEERHGGSFGSVDEAISHLRRESGLEHTPRALLEEEMAEHLVADEDGRFRQRYSRSAASQAMDALRGTQPPLREVVCPVLIVRGESSDVLSERDAEQAAEELRRGRMETVPGGHCLLWDALAETSALVRDFVLAGSLR